MRFVLSIIIGMLLTSLSTKGQVTAEDYARADSTSRWTDLVYYNNVDVHWIDDSHKFWYSVNTRKGTEYKLVDAENLKIAPAFDQEKLCQKLNELSKMKGYKPYKLKIKNLKFIDEGKAISFELAKSNWQCDLKKYELEEKGKVSEEAPEPYWGITDGEFVSEPVKSPDSTQLAYIKEYNLFVKVIETDEETQLSFDGSAGEFYSGHVVWSPDSKKLAAIKVRPNEKKYFHIIESSPKDQIQPKLHKKEYLKPGDALPIKKPCLFVVESGKKIELDTKPYEHQFDLSNLKWWPDSKAFTFEFNQRGHQLYEVAEVNAETGNLRSIIKETSKTFIDYSGKHFRYDADNTKEIIWASERDGWNHLYLIDAETGEVKNQITKGEWPVREVVHVDEKNRTILFQASGRYTDEDPYFIHYCSINFDGSNLIDLTPEKRNHYAVFSSDYEFFTDTYSTVNQPPVVVLRRSNDGKVITQLEKADASDLYIQNWIAPEVFVAKARDGVTDIWGNIYFPSNFDSTKQYPVIEYIYAGPQGSFTQRTFKPYLYAISGLAEVGFIIVELDGMGTSHRSKAFHDVCFKDLKDAGFPDRIKWIKAAAETRPFMDTTRVGLYGGSAGGQNSTAGVLFYPEFYKVAVSSCGCHDNRMDKMWWNEQWLGYPIGKQYDECSNVSNAFRLQGDLMLIVGEMDDNVDPASTMQVADALIKANKDFELVVLPGVNHTLGGEFGEHKRRDFFVKCLYNQLPPKWKK